MILLARYLNVKFGIMSYLKYTSFFNMVGLSHVQCYTCLCNISFFQLKFHKPKNLIHCSLSTTNNMMSIYPFYNSIQKTINQCFNKILAVDTSKQKLAGFVWYRTIDQVNYQEFFQLLKMADTYYSWFKVTELHVWMLLVRLMQNGKSYRVIRTSIMDAMWVDVENRAKLVEPLNKDFKKNVKDLYERFKVTLFIYDEGYLSNDMILTGALWFQFFEKNCDDPRLLEALTSFVRYQLHYMQMIDTEIHGNKEIKKQIWTSLRPHFENIN